MQSVDLDQAEFYGQVSRPPAEPQRTRPECSRCGSSLAGRFEGAQRFGRQVVHVWRCGCGATRRIKREAAM